MKELNKIERRRKWKEIFVRVKGGRCNMCGHTFPQYCMEFHHLLPGDSISDILRQQKWEFENKEHVDYLMKELAKTVMLDRNCHAMCHHQ